MKLAHDNTSQYNLWWKEFNQNLLREAVNVWKFIKVCKQSSQ
jgi:hypothetical protein